MYRALAVHKGEPHETNDECHVDLLAQRSYPVIVQAAASSALLLRKEAIT